MWKAVLVSVFAIACGIVILLPQINQPFATKPVTRVDPIAATISNSGAPDSGAPETLNTAQATVAENYVVLDIGSFQSPPQFIRVNENGDSLFIEKGEDFERNLNIKEAKSGKIAKEDVDLIFRSLIPQALRDKTNHSENEGVFEGAPISLVTHISGSIRVWEAISNFNHPMFKVQWFAELNKVLETIPSKLQRLPETAFALVRKVDKEWDATIRKQGKLRIQMFGPKELVPYPSILAALKAPEEFFPITNAEDIFLSAYIQDSAGLFFAYKGQTYVIVKPKTLSSKK